MSGTAACSSGPPQPSIDAIGQWAAGIWPVGWPGSIRPRNGPRETPYWRSCYPGLPSISVDYGVMEKADNVLVLGGYFGWSDVGSWDALWEVSPKDPSGNVLKGSVAVTGTRNPSSWPGNRLVALAGVEDLIVVDTEDCASCLPARRLPAGQGIGGPSGEGRTHTVISDRHCTDSNRETFHRVLENTAGRVLRVPRPRSCQRPRLQHF